MSSPHRPPRSGATPPRSLRPLVVAACLALVVTVAGATWPSPASAAPAAVTTGGSILYIKADNVWIAKPDGTGQRQLTTDGTASHPYRNPSRSTNGNVIVAVQDRPEQDGGFVRSYLYEMDGQGNLLRAPFAPTQYTTVLGGSCTVPVLTAPQGILAEVSPDGTKIAVNPLANFYNFDCGGTFESVVSVINLDGSVVTGQVQPPSGDIALAYDEPSWVSNTRLLMYHSLNNGIMYFDLGAATAHPWVTSSDFSDNAYQYPDLHGGKLATTGSDDSGNPVLRIWTSNGPTTAPVPRCDISDPAQHNIFDFNFAVPRLASDGSALVWQETDSTGSSPVTSTYISPVGAISGGSCSSISRQLFVAGASDPFWSPAAVPAPPSVPGPPTGAHGSAGNGQVTLSWTAPANTGGKPITGYEVTPYIGAAAQPVRTFASPATTQVISGLTNGTGYRFTVAAVNSVGTGAASSPSSTITPTAPALDPDQRFVTAAYTDFLDRAPTTAERDGAAGQLDRGATTRANVVRGLASSDEWVTTIVDKLYEDTLGRAGDSGGIAYWVGELSSRRRSVASVAANFYASAEYYQGIGGNTDRSWITDLYHKILLRAPDAGGLDYWVGQVAATNRVSVARRFYQSSESAHTRVEALYEKLLGRAADAGGADYWAGRVVTDGDISLAINLASSDEYFQRAQTRFS